MSIQAGDVFPRLHAETYDGHKMDLGDYLGKNNVVLYFYPRDLTPGCSREAIDFDRQLKAFEALDAVVIGMSVDSLDSHQNFARALGLNFPLISDTDRSVSRELGILNDTGTYAKRTTFLVDKQGTLRKIFHVTQVDGHVDEVLDALRELV